MPIDLSGVRLKLNRAQEHLRTLDAELEAFQQRYPFRFGTYPNADGTEHTVVVIAHEDIPLRWSLLLGEFLYNLRSSLDHLVWQLVLANRQVPDAQNEFPIFLDPDKYSKAVAKKLRGVPSDTLPIFNLLQPHSDPEWNGLRELHPLWLLQQLGNADKHRFLHPITCLAEELTLKTPETFPGNGIEFFEVDVIHDGTVLAIVRPKSPVRKMKMDGQLVTVVQIEETAQTPRLPWGVLDAMFRKAGNAIAWLGRNS